MDDFLGPFITRPELNAEYLSKYEHQKLLDAQDRAFQRQIMDLKKNQVKAHRRILILMALLMATIMLLGVNQYMATRNAHTNMYIVGQETRDNTIWRLRVQAGAASLITKKK